MREKVLWPFCLVLVVVVVDPQIDFYMPSVY